MVKTVDYMKYTDAVEAMCDKYCKMPDIAASQDELTDICNDCPINTLFCDKEEDSDNPYQEQKERQKKMNERKIKCELYNDSMQGWKCYPIQKAQLIIADVPYNVGNFFYGSNPMWYV